MRRIAGLACCILALTSCQREKRDVRPAPVRTVTFGSAAREDTIEPGGKLPQYQAVNPYDRSAWAISEGQRLFDWYNCSGCHSHGGGGIGPPLIKTTWIYGGEPDNLFDTIVKGRPNGMPTWGGRIPEYQIWQLVAFIRSMNKEEPQSATPARTDEIQISPTLKQKVNGVTK
ncbi:MAG TPA: c-type cytochrome [Candidatus Limnocylindrales bacterium]|nr:c-type cytochrome [Candidatus Limnocylindrales bacterium]